MEETLNVQSLTHWATPGELEITPYGFSVGPLAMMIKRMSTPQLILQYYFWHTPPKDPLFLIGWNSDSLEHCNLYIERGGTRAMSQWLAGRWGWYPIWLISDHPWQWPTPGLRLAQDRSIEIMESMPLVSSNDFQFLERTSTNLGCSQGVRDLYSKVVDSPKQRPPFQGWIKFAGQWIELPGRHSSDIRIDCDQRQDLRDCLRELMTRCSGNEYVA